MTAGVIAVIRFQSTLSMRRATCRDGGGSSKYPPFQSTLSMRRATHRSTARNQSSFDFNPRSP